MGDWAAGFHSGGRLGPCRVASMWEKGTSVPALKQIVFPSLSFQLFPKLFCFLLHVWREEVRGVAAVFACSFGCRVPVGVYDGGRRRRLCNSVVYIAAAL